MKFGHLDKVMVENGPNHGKVGIVVSRNQVHKNNVPEMPVYTLRFDDTPTPAQFPEDNLSIYEKFDKEKADKEAKERIAAEKAERDRQAELKMEEALRKKIHRELEIRAEVEAEFAAKQNPKTS